MGTTQQKLNYLANAVSGIKSAIESRGVVVGNAPLAQYATKIEEIPSDNIASVVDKSVTEITADMLEGATEIGDYTFYGCTDLTMACIPNTVTSIGDCAFYGCTSLATILFFGTQTEWNAITKGTDWDGNTGAYTVVFGSAGLAYISNGDGTCYVSGIGSCEDSDIIIPPISPDGETVTRIGNGSFSRDRSITSVYISEGITAIGSSAFRGCSNLTSVSIPPSLTLIGNSAFGEAGTSTTPSYIERVYITDLAAWCGIAFGDDGSSPFYGNNGDLYISGVKATDITIPSTITTVGNYQFAGCGSLISITIPNSVTSIGTRAFKSCPRLTSVTGADSVTSIGAYAFYGCTALRSFTIGNGITSIRDGSFYECYGLTSITIPDSVTSIGWYAFYYCHGLTSVTLGTGVTSISGGAFDGCSKLIEVHNLSSLPIEMGSSSYGYVGRFAKHVYSSGDSYLHTTVDGYVFYENGDEVYLMGYAGNQTALTLPNTYNNKNYPIYEYSFYYCSWLESISIPDSVTNIGHRAFYNCTGLSSVTLGNGVTSIEQYTFYGCSSLSSIVIPDSVTSIGQQAFYDCSGLQNVQIGANIARCYYSPFEGDSSIESFVIMTETPPVLYNSGSNHGYGLFGGASAGIYMPPCMISVPAASVDAYKTAQVWNSYANYIQAYN